MAEQEPLSSTLRGLGLKRDVFDQHLTQKEDAPRPPKFEHLPYSTSQTGLVYDVRMRFHVESSPMPDDIHPEDPRRIHAIFEALVNAGLAWRAGTGSEPASFYMGRIDARKVTQEEACLVHTVKHWEWVQSLRHMTAEDLKDEQQHDYPMDSVYLSPNTPFCAELSAGGAVEACRAVVQGKVKNAFAVIRPPGHHAEREDAKGFCFFDNVSIATKACQKEFGDACQRVLILDFDVHHGNAIQQAHYDNPNVLYISLHVFKNGTFYPEGTYRDGRQSYGDHFHCGEGPGLGRNVNIPWSKIGMGDGDYIYAFDQIVTPIGREFNPDLVVVAAGFDAARGDMLGGCDVTPAGYAYMIYALMSLAGGKVAVCLEGGYNLDSIAKSGVAVAQTLMGEPPPRLEENTLPSVSGVSDVKKVLRQQSKYWKSLYPKDVSGPPLGQRVDGVVRQYQQSTLWDEHQMSTLFIPDQLSRYGQVLATLDHMAAKPLLILLHEPPEMIASPDPLTGQLELHNTWLTDAVKTYIDDAVRLEFAVIDVTLPRVAEEETDMYEDTAEVKDRISEATRLLTYIYENYSGESEHIFLLGTNVGHGAIIGFLKAHEETAPERVMATIHFVQDVPLTACRSATTDVLSLWYWRNSLVFLSSKHNYWSTELAAKPRKKYGRLHRCTDNNMSEMLLTAKEEVFKRLREETEEWRENQQSSLQHPLDEALPEIVLSSPPRRLPPVSNFAFSSPRAG